MTKKVKFEEDCEVPFKLDWMARFGSEKFCGVELKSGKKNQLYPGSGRSPILHGICHSVAQNSRRACFLKRNAETEVKS